MGYVGILCNAPPCKREGAISPAQSNAGSGFVRPWGHDRRRGCPEGMHLIHLICLHCHRSNAAEAKFCGECGAALLRKFCGSCHAANDLTAHFCQSCGGLLPSIPQTVPATSAVPATPTSVVPNLTDVVSMPSNGAHQGSYGPVNMDSGAIVEFVPHGPPTTAGDSADRTALPRRRPYLRPLAMGAGAALAIGMALALWPRSQQPIARSNAGAEAVPGPSPIERSLGVGAATAVPAAAEAMSQPALPASGLSRDPLGGSALSPSPSIPPRVAREPGKLAGKRANAELAPAERAANGQGQASPAGPNVARPSRLPATPQPALPKECTPAMDALSLCAPGSTSTGR